MSEDPKPHRRWFQFNLVELLLLVALIGGGFGTYIWFRDPPNRNYRLFIGLYVAVFSVATIGALPWKIVGSNWPTTPSKLMARRLSAVFALFGWAFLFFILQSGGGASTQSLVSSLRLGLILATLTALAASLLFSRLFDR